MKKPLTPLDSRYKILLSLTKRTVFESVNIGGLRESTASSKQGAVRKDVSCVLCVKVPLKKCAIAVKYDNWRIRSRLFLQKK